MNPIPPLALAGCAAEPVGNYLKALGVFRLLGEQLDPDVRAWWHNGVFHLQLSTKATYESDGKEHPCPQDERAIQGWLIGWFLHRCEYSPCIAPWQKNTGFLFFDKKEKKLETTAGVDGLRAILNSGKAAAHLYRESMKLYAMALGLGEVGDTEIGNLLDKLKSYKDEKLFKKLNTPATKSAGQAELAARVRNFSQNLSFTRWLDAIGAPRTTSRSKRYIEWFTLLGFAGAGEGRSQYIVSLLDALYHMLIGDPIDKESPSMLRSALFGELHAGAISAKYSTGLFFPERKGEFNMGQTLGKETARGNPWELILVMEGGLLFSSSVTRRRSANRADAAFPFYCESSIGGTPITAPNETPRAERGISLGEVWCPLWIRRATIEEVRPVFAEGRFQIGQRTCRHAIEFVRAVSRFGMERGISAFVRYALLRRSGSGDNTTTVTTPLGMYVPTLNRDIFLLDELDDFLAGVAKNVQVHDNQPQRIVLARKALEDAVFTAASQTVRGEHSRGAVFNVLVAAAALEGECGVTGGQVKKKEGKTTRTVTAPTIPPLGRSCLWIGSHEQPQLFDDGTSEFRLARAIGSIQAWGEATADQPHAVGPIRENLQPVNLARERSGDFVWRWWPESRRAVWQRGRPIFDNLSAVLERRLIDSQKGAGDGLPLASGFQASYSDVLALWNNELDEDRLDKLIHAVALINHRTKREDQDAARETHDSTPDLSGGGVWFRDDEPQTNWQLPTWLGGTEYEAALALPRLYLLLKLCFIGEKLPAVPVEHRTVARSGSEPFAPGNLQFLRLLLAGRASDAAALAARLLRARGYPTIIESRSGMPIEIHETIPNCRRIAGLLLIPINRPGVLAALVIKPQTRP